MGRFIEGSNQTQATLLPETIDDHISEDNPVRVVDAFVDALDKSSAAVIAQPPEKAGIDPPSYAAILKHAKEK